MAYAAFVALALIWGVSFLFIKVGVQDMGPTGLVLVRSVSGAVALAVIVRVMGRPLFGPDWKTRNPSLRDHGRRQRAPALGGDRVG